MNYKKFINKIELLENRNSFNSKFFFKKNIKKKDFVLLGYHEFDKEEIQLEQFDGICLKFRSSGLNTKLVLNSQLSRDKVKLNFFFYNPSLFDIDIVK